MPAWQSGPGVINPDSSGTPCGAGSGYCREVPDVSASADPSHGYIIRWHGKWLPVGGTSAATPLWAATLADIESANSPVYRAGIPESAAVLGGRDVGDELQRHHRRQQRLHRYERRAVSGHNRLRHGVGAGIADRYRTGVRYRGDRFEDRVHRRAWNWISAALPRHA